MTAPDDGLPAPDKTPFKIEAAEDLLDLPDPDWLVRDIIPSGRARSSWPLRHRAASSSA